MRDMRWFLVLRCCMAALLIALGVASLVDGRAFVGVLLLALAAVNIAMTLTIRRRRAALAARFPGLAERRTSPAR